MKSKRLPKLSSGKMFHFTHSDDHGFLLLLQNLLFISHESVPSGFLGSLLVNFSKSAQDFTLPPRKLLELAKLHRIPLLSSYQRRQTAFYDGCNHVRRMWAEGWNHVVVMSHDKFSEYHEVYFTVLIAKSCKNWLFNYYRATDPTFCLFIVTCNDGLFLSSLTLEQL